MNVIESIERDGAQLVNKEKSTVYFICKCGTAYNKAVRAICNTSGAYCKDCTDRNTQIKKLNNKIAINNSLLERGL
jgi:hypothetical protein